MENIQAEIGQEDNGNKFHYAIQVGREVGISNSQTDYIVDDQHNMGLIKKIGTTKILLTFEGKQEVERSNST